jgi:hypothetical protein
VAFVVDGYKSQKLRSTNEEKDIPLDHRCANISLTRTPSFTPSANLGFFTNPAARIRIQVIDLSAETYTSTGTLHLFKLHRIKVE